MAQVVFSPRETPDWFSDKARQAQSSILVAAPYIGRVLEELVSDCNPRVSIEIFTSLRISDVLSGATDVDAVYRLSKRARVRSIGNLHAKVYMVDERYVLVTSANPTQSGWHVNLEVGLAIQDETMAKQIKAALEEASPAPWTSFELERYARLAQNQSIPRLIRLPEPKDLVRGVFGGWLELAVAGLEFVPAEFTLEQAYQALLPLAKRHYPRNKHPEAKIRQQLQRLRDLGVLEFMGRGIYRVIKSPSS